MPGVNLAERLLSSDKAILWESQKLRDTSSRRGAEFAYWANVGHVAQPSGAITGFGVIGVGHLVRHMMPMLVTGGHRVLLSARNRDTAAELAKRFGLEVVEDNAEIVARADVVIFAVRPYDAVSVAGGLAWRTT